jgi:hypothetical protein
MLASSWINSSKVTTAAIFRVRVSPASGSCDSVRLTMACTTAIRLRMRCTSSRAGAPPRSIEDFRATQNNSTPSSSSVTAVAAFAGDFGAIPKPRRKSRCTSRSRSIV